MGCVKKSKAAIAKAIRKRGNKRKIKIVPDFRIPRKKKKKYKILWAGRDEYDRKSFIIKKSIEKRRFENSTTAVWSCKVEWK